MNTKLATVTYIELRRVKITKRRTHIVGKEEQGFIMASLDLNTRQVEQDDAISTTKSLLQVPSAGSVQNLQTKVDF